MRGPQVVKPGEGLWERRSPNVTEGKGGSGLLAGALVRTQALAGVAEQLEICSCCSQHFL